MNLPLPKKLNHGRVKERYNPVPTAREKAYHLWLMGQHSCACGCGNPSTIVHHVLSIHRLKRWRRDHEIVVPMDSHCHFDLHGGDARKTEADKGMVQAAIDHRSQGYEAGIL